MRFGQDGEVDMVELCKRPGWGIEINEAAVAAHPSHRLASHGTVPLGLGDGSSARL